jgi:3',5'-cyclic AMP phosphodiesterase CpdA
MPFLFPPSASRRHFLKQATLGGASLLVAAARTAPAASDPLAPGAGIRLALLSDTHIPADRTNAYRGFRPWENLQRIVAEVVAAQPQGVILCGDAARFDGQLADYEQLRSLLEPLAAVAPVYIALGNHDDRTHFLRVFPQPPGLRPDAGGKHVTVIEFPTLRLLVLDSLLYVDRVAGLLGQAQRRWLARSLPEIQDRPAVIFVHHTLGDGDGDLLDADRLFHLLAPHPHVKAIFYGHSHVWEVGRQDHLHLVNLPPTAYNFRDQDPVGWVLAQFHPQGVSLTLRASAGNRAEDGSITSLAWQ